MWNFISDKCSFYVVYFSGLKYPLMFLNTQPMVSNYDDKSVLHNHKNSQHVILGSPWFLSFILDIVNNRLGFWPRSQLH